jgi:hypothetical protein
MKKLFILLVFAITVIATAQAPQGFNYQATVRNSAGQLLLNQIVLVKFNVLQNSDTGTVVYSENQTANTDDLGHINLVVGQGTPFIGTFSTINWGSGTYYLGIELNTGSGYVAMGTTQLLSVPYALHANTATSTNGNTGGFTHYVGELFGGGIVVSVWKTNGVEHGLIASLTNLSNGIQWTTPPFQLTHLGAAVSQSFKDGFANTNAIVAQAGAGTTYAAGLCKAYNAGGYTDWYLPAIWELKECYDAAKVVNEVLGDSNGFLTYPNNNSQSIFNQADYWSSTEGSIYNSPDGYYGAYLLNFEDGDSWSNSGSFYGGKTAFLSVRAVRKF